MQQVWQENFCEVGNEEQARFAGRLEPGNKGASRASQNGVDMHSEPAGAPFSSLIPQPSLERLRDRLRPLPPRPLGYDHLKPAAVLLPLFEDQGRLHVLLTVRTMTVRAHKGQVCFPGGAYQSEDSDLVTTALRETHEEIGLASSEVELLGQLAPLPTISDFCVLPLVARIPWPVALTPNPDEIADVFTVDLETLCRPEHCRIDTREHGGVHYYPIFHFTGGRHPIWGITGYLVAQLLNVVSDWYPPQLERKRVNLPHSLGLHW